MALSYYQQSPAGLQAADPSAVGLGWPGEPLPDRVNGVAGTGIGGLGWPESSGGREDSSLPPDAEDRKAVPLSSGLISPEQDAGQESRGIQVNQERSGPDSFVRPVGGRASRHERSCRAKTQVNLTAGPAANSPSSTARMILLCIVLMSGAMSERSTMAMSPGK